MNSFNVYGQTETKIGGNTPVWLGTVKPIPVGATATVKAGQKIKAGALVIYNPEEKTVEPVTSLGGGQEASANAYLYNDVYADPIPGVDYASVPYTCAVVMCHPEGLLIERVYPEITEEQIATLQAQIPGVLLVRG